MENISYFCIVKRFISILKLSGLVIMMNLTSFSMAANQQEDVLDNDAWIDSVEISLLTCGPKDEVYALYGHTALRVQDTFHHQDLAVNWGMFNMKEKFFVLRFVFGLTDYQIALIPTAEMLDDYARDGRWIIQQHISLTRQEKKSVLAAINENLRPENVSYRYNYFYDNCCTRPRDILINNIKNANYPAPKETETTYREQIHEWNENHRWARFGNDLLLGVKSDLPITSREAEFLPDNLRKTFDEWSRVDSTFYILPRQMEVTESNTITPLFCFILLTIIVCVLTFIGYKKKWKLLWLDATLMILTGLPGIILFAMIFSQHPTVSSNLQIFILNPLTLVGVFYFLRRKWRKKVTWAWLACIIIGIIGSFWQNYAEGIPLLAFSLLIRCIDRLRNDE